MTLEELFRHHLQNGGYLFAVEAHLNPLNEVDVLIHSYDQYGDTERRKVVGDELLHWTEKSN